MAHTCMAGCGKRITWRFAICAKCEDVYGRSARQWPEWLRFLWQDEQRQRRKNKKFMDNEVCETDLGKEEAFGDEF